MSHSLLDPEQLASALEGLPQWSSTDGKLHRSFRFPDFVSAFDWMTHIAVEAERLGHHPNWSNVYNQVEVTLWTHDKGGVTELDVALATFMESAATASP
jgi:4a-hydroxytetrahydrobiopterin dehydratase